MKPLMLLLIAATSDPTPDLGWVGPAEQEAQPVRYDTPAESTTPMPAAPGLLATAPAPKPAAASNFGQRLTALNLALSATVIDDPSRWRFERLDSEARALSALASTEAERAELRGVTDRIDRFAAISARFRRSRESANGWRRPSDAPIAANRGRVAPPVQLTKAGANRHDAEGTLRPVVSKRAGAPKYAVVNDQGKIAALVTSTPKTEKQLDKLLGKRVGLDGRRGYLTDLRREHVVAERVTPLETIRR